MIYDLEKENKEILARYKDLISNTYRTLDEEQNKLIRKALILLWMLTKISVEKLENHTSTIR